MNRVLLIISLCVYCICLCAQSYTGTSLIPIDQIVLSDCLDKSVKDQNEIFSYEWDDYNVLSIYHKDVLVNSSSNIAVAVAYSNDSIFIREEEVAAEDYRDDKCLRNLSYEIKLGDKRGDLFLVLMSSVSSDSYQVFFINPYTECDYPITEKSNYQYKPFIMDGTCEWIINSAYGYDGYKEIISNIDTLILGKTYKQIFTSPCRRPNEKNYAGAIREEGKRIFFIDTWYADGSILKPERMIYDFNLKEGDRLEYEGGGYPFLNTLELCVLHVDTILMEGIPRRKIYFGSSDDDFWIEGIGSKYVFTHPFPSIMTGFNPVLAGVWQNGKSLYCGYHCTCDQLSSVVERKSTVGFHILKNPVENRLLQIDVHASDFSRIDLYSFDGKLVVSEKIAVDREFLEIPLLDLSGNYIVILSRLDGSRESAKIVVL